MLHAQADAEPLNVVLLVSDDQRWDSLGVAGNPVIHTPHLDQLASQGIRFTHAYVATSICMSSRATLLTGQSMSRHGIDRFGKPLTQEQFALTYAGQLRAAGYYSGFVGKYGVGPIRGDDFDFAQAYEGRHWLDRNGQRIHVTEQNARDAIHFLKTRPADRPFVLSVSFFAPHAEDSATEQYLPQPWSAEWYANRVVPTSPLANQEYLDALPHFLRDQRNEGRVRYHWRFDTPERFQTSMINYYRLITEIDQAVGRIVELLKEQGVDDRTLVIFTSDNGYFHAERGLADKWYPYEESIRVPLLVCDPRMAAGRRGTTLDAMALNLDIAPTILAAAGREIPAVMQGQDLAQLYLAEDPTATASAWRDEFFYEHPTITHRQRIPASQAVIRRDFKYVYWPEWEYEQLFDLNADPTELLNLADDARYGDQLSNFRQRLSHWREHAR